MIKINLHSRCNCIYYRILSNSLKWYSDLIILDPRRGSGSHSQDWSRYSGAWSLLWNNYLCFVCPWCVFQYVCVVCLHVYEYCACVREVSAEWEIGAFPFEGWWLTANFCFPGSMLLLARIHGALFANRELAQVPLHSGAQLMPLHCCISNNLLKPTETGKRINI